MDQLAVFGGTPVRTEPFPVWPIYGEEEEKLLLEVLRSQKWGGTGKSAVPELAPKLPELELRFADMHEAKHAVSVVNGTIGITVALQAAGVRPGDEVIIPAYTFIATASSALLFGAIPVIVDVDPDTLLIDPDKVEAAITPKTKAIVAVHIAGAPADMTRLQAIAKRHNVRLLEDSAQGVGAEWDGRRVGAIGDLGTFSFQSGKNITAGEGGIILTNDDELADRAWSLANVGRIRQGGWYQHESVGWNLRMTEFQAAVLLGQLSRFEEQFVKRERNALLLNELFKDIDGIRTVKRDERISRHAQHMHLMFLEPDLAETIDKNEMIRRLNGEGIPVHPGYVSLNRNKALLADIAKWTGEKELREYCCPASERACDKEAMWLHQNVLLADEKDMHEIAEAVRKVMRSFE
ncbi:MAG: aminotransferase DegT [Paenibacillus sp.]|nr:aminotransferase DegT [Paenibacillus sp.]